MDKTARNNWFGLQGHVPDHRPARREDGASAREVRHPADDHRPQLPQGQHPDEPVPTDGQARWPTTRPCRGWRRVAAPGMETVGDQVLVNGRFAPYKRVRPGPVPAADPERVAVLQLRLRAVRRSAVHPDRHRLGTAPAPGGATGHPARPGPARRRGRRLPRPEGRERACCSSIPRTDGSTNGTGSRTGRAHAVPGARQARPEGQGPVQPGRHPRLQGPEKVAKIWTFGLSKDQHGSYWSINGKRFDPKRVDHRVVLGSTERWRLRNTSTSPTTCTCTRSSGGRWSATASAPPPVGAGLRGHLAAGPRRERRGRREVHRLHREFMIHCHMLDHEDDGMMATFEVESSGSTVAPTGESTIFSRTA